MCTKCRINLPLIIADHLSFSATFTRLWRPASSSDTAGATLPTCHHRASVCYWEFASNASSFSLVFLPAMTSAQPRFKLGGTGTNWDKNSEARRAGLRILVLVSALFSRGVAAGFPSLLLPITTDHEGPWEGRQWPPESRAGQAHTEWHYYESRPRSGQGHAYMKEKKHLRPKTL